MSEVQFAPTPEIIRAVSTQVRRIITAVVPEESSTPGKDKEKENYRKFAEELASTHRDSHAHLTYSIHWLYQTKDQIKARQQVSHHQQQHHH